MKKLFITSILFLCFIFSFSVLQAQKSQYITRVTSAKLTLTQTQQNMLNRVQSNPFYKSWSWVTLGTITDSQDSTGVLYINIPGRTGIVKAAPKNITADSSTTYQWYGNVINDDSTGYVYISCKSGKTTASIGLLGEDYDIFSTDNNMHLMVQYDTAKLNKLNRCGTDGSVLTTSRKKKDSLSTNILQTCQDYTRVLVLYTPAALQAVADINQAISLCVAHFNTTIYNSGITSGAVVQLAGSQLFNFTESYSPVNDAATLAADANAQAARNNTNADFVVLLNNTSLWGSTYGVAASIDPTNASAYAIANINTAFNQRETFTHESGHLYGCRHDVGADPTGVPYAHGYSYTSNLQKYSTVMATINNSGSRMQNFSNPNVVVHGKATGTVNSENNAREVSEQFNTINGFRSPVFHPLGATATASKAEGCCYGSVSFEAIYSCGVAPYTFEWHSSSDGVNYGSNIIATTEITNQYIPCITGSWWYLKVIVRSSDGQSSTGFTKVAINHSCNGGKIANNPLTKNSLKEQTTLSSLHIQPNPTSGIANISFAISKPAKIKLSIYNSFGQLIKIVVDSQLQQGQYTRVFDAGNLPKGIYLCQLVIDNSVQTKSIIVK